MKKAKGRPLNKEKRPLFGGRRKIRNFFEKKKEATRASFGVIFAGAKVLFYSPLLLQTRVAHITADGNITAKQYHSP
jgi:hypothetical protein